MNIRRPQPTRATSRRLKWWHFVKRYRAWRAERLAQRIETALERLKMRTWANGLQCIECRAVVALGAKYCQECGAGLPTTEPMLFTVPPLPPQKVLHPPKTGMLARTWNKVDGGPRTKTMRAISAVEMAQELQQEDQQRMKEQEGQNT